MIKVSIIGTGNVSFHLQNAFSKTSAVQVLDVLPGRSDFSDSFLGKDFSNDDRQGADIYIIAVSDDAISRVSKQFKNCKKLVVHTSGSVSINTLLDSERRGVFYPLQTFSKEREVNFKTIPICVEADNSKDLALLTNLGETISDSVYEINSAQRKALHLGAVFVNNFTNHLYQIGHEICLENNVSFDLLRPLIAETAAKIESLNPKEAQTGPAKRDDMKTIKNHIEYLRTKKQREVYSILTESIQNTYGEKL